MAVNNLNTRIGNLNNLSIEKIFHCLEKELFFDNYWEKTKFFSKKLLSDTDIESFFPLHSFDSLLTGGGLMHPHLDIVNRGNKNGAPLKTSPSPGTDVAHLLKQYDSGATIRIPHIEQHINELGLFCGDLEHIVGMPIRVNLYMSPPFSQGFSAHFDMDDIFVLQVHGQKTWFIHNEYTNQLQLPNSEQMFTSQRHISQVPPQEIPLDKGDLLYLPRGFMHEARSNENASIHLTFAPIGIAKSDLIAEVIKMIAKDTLAMRKRYQASLCDPKEKVKNLKHDIESIIPMLLDDKYLEKVVRIADNTVKNHRNGDHRGEILTRLYNG